MVFKFALSGRIHTAIPRIARLDTQSSQKWSPCPSGRCLCGTTRWPVLSAVEVGDVRQSAVQHAFPKCRTNMFTQIAVVMVALCHLIVIVAAFRLPGGNITADWEACLRRYENVDRLLLSLMHFHPANSTQGLTLETTTSSIRNSLISKKEKSCRRTLASSVAAGVL